MIQFQNQPMVLPSGQIVDSGITRAEYERRVLEAIDLYDCGYREAEMIVDCKLLEVRK